MATLGKAQGRITIPTGGWSASIAGAGTATATVAAGDYYLSSTTSLITAVQTAFNAISATTGTTFTVTLDDAADGSTGKVSITPLSHNVTITWSSTSLRDVLGFTGSSTVMTANVTSVGASHALYLWLPNAPRFDSIMPDGDQGRPVSDLTVSVAPSGESRALYYTTRFEDVWGFQHILGNKAITSNEAVTNESLQTFWATVIGKGIPFRWHKLRSDNSTFVTYRGTADASVFNCSRMFGGWYGAFSRWAYATPVIKLV